MTIEFTPEQLQALMNYLAARPWAEVNAIIVPIVDQVNKPQQPPLHAVDG
jgi:hypothetical protein